MMCISQSLLATCHAPIADYHSSNIARNRSFEVRVEDTMDDERPPRGRDRPPTIFNVPGRSREPVIQENLEHIVTAAHLENIPNDFHTKMVAVVQEQIKSNILFFHVNLDSDSANPLRGGFSRRSSISKSACSSGTV